MFDETHHTTADLSAAEIKAKALGLLGIETAGRPGNDPLQNSAKTVDFGLGQNAYSTTSRYLPGKNNHKAAVHFDKYENVENAVADAVVYALEIGPKSYEKATGYKATEEHFKGTTATIAEKFGFKMEMTESAIEQCLIDSYDNIESYETEKSVCDLEGDGEDIVLSVNGKRTSFQVKTGSNRDRKNADHLIVATVEMDSRKLSFEVKE
jgi:hypothetical protein